MDCRTSFNYFLLPSLVLTLPLHLNSGLQELSGTAIWNQFRTENTSDGPQRSVLFQWVLTTRSHFALIHFCHFHFPPLFPEHPRTQSSELQLGPSNFRLNRFFYVGTLDCDSASWTLWCYKPCPLRPQWSLSSYHAYHCKKKSFYTINLHKRTLATSFIVFFFYSACNILPRIN